MDDEIGYEHVGRPKSDERFLQVYVERIISALDTGVFMYVAHPDIINYVGSVDRYEKYMIELLNELKKRHMPIEVNVNGFRSGCDYPDTRFIKMGVQNGNDFIIGVDAHAPNELMDYTNFEKCVQLVKSIGGKIINL